MTKQFKNRQIQLFTILLVISFLGDVLRRLSFYFDHEFTRYTTLSKLIFIIVSVPLILPFREHIRHDILKHKILKNTILLLLIFLIGQLSSFYNTGVSSFFDNLEFLGKYLFFPFVLYLFINLREDSIALDWLMKVFEVFFFINAFAILVGFIFEIRVFQTYYFGERFGYKGIYSNSGQTSLYFILMVFYYTHKLIFESFSKLTLIKLVLIISISLLVGTKRIYFFYPLLILYYLFFLNGIRKWSTFKVTTIIIIIIIMFSNKINNVMLNTYNLFYSIYLEKGFLSSFTSYRTDLIKEIISLKIAPNWSLANYYFGGMNFINGRSEMGFVDLYLFFGLVGSVLYMYFYKIIFNFKFPHHFYWFFILSLLLIVFVADAFILDTNIPILLFLISSYFYSFVKRKYV